MNAEDLVSHFHRLLTLFYNNFIYMFTRFAESFSQVLPVEDAGKLDKVESVVNPVPYNSLVGSALAALLHSQPIISKIIAHRSNAAP